MACPAGRADYIDHQVFSNDKVIKKTNTVRTKRMAGGEIKGYVMDSNAAGGRDANLLLRKYRWPPLQLNHRHQLGDEHQNKVDGLYPEVWHACAGPLVYVPQVGDSVYYFPQGHIQQVLACINVDSEIELPPCNLPAKLLCKVTDVQLKVEAGSDEVFALIVLLPLAEEEQVDDVMRRKDDGRSRRKSSGSGRSFTKKLTPSDTGKHGGFSVPRRQAEECLPPLDMSQEPPVQEIAAKDLHGNLWRFRHIYRGDPKRHLLTSGWSTFATSKRISPGDQFIFVRGENGELRVGVRRGASRQQHNNNNSSSSSSISAAATVISANCMLHGILSDASNAVSNRSTFIAYYRPWSNSSEFIVPASQYLKSADIDYSPGTRFRMSFEAEDCVEQRIEKFEATVVSSKIADPLHWPDSEWEGLTVKWDPTSDTFVRPQRVSHWNIEPIEPIRLKQPTSPLRYPKSPNADTQFLANHHFNQIAKGMMRNNPFHLQSLDLEGFRRQDNKKTKIEKSDEPKPSIIPHWMIYPPTNFPVSYATSPASNMLQGPIVANPIVDLDPGPKILLSSPVSCLESGEEANEALHLVSPSDDQSERKCMLFGVNLSGQPLELPSPQIVTSGSEIESLTNHSIPPSTSQSSVSETISKTSAPIDHHHHYQANHGQCNSCTFASSSLVNRTCVKVRKQGSQQGRLVDLMQYKGHGQLISELDQMFGFRGSLTDRNSGWHVTYVDPETDTDRILFPILDREWQQLLTVAQKMVICPKEAN